MQEGLVKVKNIIYHVVVSLIKSVKEFNNLVYILWNYKIPVEMVKI